ncbi:tryptophan synthase subunit alpha [Candidatus Nitrospira bockiana]
MNRIDTAFQRLRARGEKALITYIMAGDPSLHDTEELVMALEQAGADVIELGVPFSDPIADGPVIQKAAERALRSGTSLRRILDTVASVRRRTQVPIVLMAYYNTIGAFGEAAFCRQATAAGVDGLIVPDMPPEESESLAHPAETAGLHLIFLVAPTSTPARRELAAGRSRGFIYYVSLTGITGATLTDIDDVARNVRKVQRLTKTPIAIGFGVATADDAARMAPIADGVIVGSAIVRQVDAHHQDPRMPDRVAEFVRSLKSALQVAPVAGR